MRVTTLAVLVAICVSLEASGLRIWWSGWDLVINDDLCGLTLRYENSDRSDRKSYGALADTPFYSIKIGYASLSRKSNLPAYASFEPGRDFFLLYLNARQPRTSADAVSGVFVSGVPILPVRPEENSRSEEIFVLYGVDVEKLLAEFRSEREIPIEIRLVDGRVIETAVDPSSRGRFDVWFESFSACKKHNREAQ